MISRKGKHEKKKMPSPEYRNYKNARDIGLAVAILICLGGGVLTLSSYGNYDNIDAVKVAVLNNPTTDDCTSPPSGSTTTNCKGGGEGWVTSALISGIVLVSLPLLTMLISFFGMKSTTERVRASCEMIKKESRKDAEFFWKQLRTSAKGVATGYYIMSTLNLLTGAYALTTAIWATIGLSNSATTDNDNYFFLLQVIGFYLGAFGALVACGIMGWLGYKAMKMCTNDKLGEDVLGAGKMDMPMAAQQYGRSIRRRR